MVDPVSVTDDVVAGTTALAGLILVYLGNVASGLASFEEDERGAVRATYRFRAWFAFAGMVIAIVSTMLAITAKWSNSACIAVWAIVLLFLALFWGIALAFLTAREIK
jgi:NAD/NADP transhydrogenase beta subunit